MSPKPAPIPSPYNFVPLSGHIYTPRWHDQVSQDLPFSNGWSGSFTITLRNTTSLFIRNAGYHEDMKKKIDGETDEQYKERAWAYLSSFQLPGSTREQPCYAIPPSSLKGMIRSALEIATFGHFNRVDNRRYGVRDLHNKKVYTDNFTRNDGNVFATKVKAAWLSLSPEKKWQLVPCDMGRVDHEVLLEHAQKPGYSFDKASDAIRRYNLWKSFKQPLKVKATVEDEKNHQHSENKRLRYRRVLSLSGSTEGTLVFTGQATDKLDRQGEKRKSAKHMEFFFYNERPEDAVLVEEDMKQDFIFIHSDERGQPNTEWAYWKAKLGKNQRVPVFYLEDDNVGLHSFGLAMMFRLPYKHTIHDMIAHTSKDHLSDTHSPDLAELMFGTVRGSHFLKGRVHFEPAIAQENSAKTHTDWVETTLASPRPTFYPNYVQQPDKDTTTGEISGEYKTYMDDDAELRGWKRYIRSGIEREKNDPPVKQGKINEDLVTRCIPLQPGAEFSARINVHNLRLEELGALFWALEWGGDDKLCHAIGLGKAFGWGNLVIKIDETFLKCLRPVDPNRQDMNLSGTELKQSATNSFITGMDTFIEEKFGKGKKWFDSDQIKALLALSNPDAPRPHALCYPSLSSDSHDGHESFANYKKHIRPSNRNPNLQPRTPYALLDIVPGLRAAVKKPAPPRGESGFKVGASVLCVLLDQRTKKGKPKFQIVGADASTQGGLTAQSPVPPGAEDPANAGMTFTLMIKVTTKYNFSYFFETEKQD